MAESPPVEHIVVFQLADELYGIGIELVREIIRPPMITPVPRTPPFVAGVANLRKRVLPVLDLRTRFGLPAADEPPPTARVIVLEIDGVGVGAAVEALRAIRAVDPGARVAMLTAMGQQQIVIDAVKCGAKDFVVKPFERDRVLAAVAKLVG